MSPSRWSVFTETRQVTDKKAHFKLAHPSQGIHLLLLTRQSVLQSGDQEARPAAPGPGLPPSLCWFPLCWFPCSGSPTGRARCCEQPQVQILTAWPSQNKGSVSSAMFQQKTLTEGSPWTHLGHETSLTPSCSQTGGIVLTAEPGPEPTGTRWAGGGGQVIPEEEQRRDRCNVGRINAAQCVPTRVRGPGADKPAFAGQTAIQQASMKGLLYTKQACGAHWPTVSLRRPS